MIPRTISRKQSREIDRRAIERLGMSGLVLMENAGRGAADVMCSLGIDGPVLIVCGHGNNGGDGLVIARHLDLRGHQVYVGVVPPAAKLEDPNDPWDAVDWLSPDAAANYRILQSTDVPMEIISGANDLKGVLPEVAWIVDALLGTGARGEPAAPLDEIIEAINASGKRILAVDIPSGLDCDSGMPARRAIRAQHTCTFVAHKPGFFSALAPQFTGEVHVVDIGVPRKLVEEVLISE